MVSDRRNDAIHPTLGRATQPAQRTLDDLEGARVGYGGCVALESTGGAALTDFTMGGRFSGVAWSLNPYTGCQHACTYCYVPDTIHAERRRWGSYVVAKRDLPTRLGHEMRRKRRLTVYLSTATDPYQPAERDHRITRRALHLIVRKDWPLEVLTRSPLVLRDLDLLARLSQVRVGLSIPSLDDGVRRLLEPSAPPVSTRLRVLRRVAEAGIPTFANYTPAMPPTTFDADTLARSMLEIGVQWVNTSPWRRRATTVPPAWDRLRGTPYEGLLRFACDRKAARSWRREMDEAFRAVGLPLRTGFFNPPFAWMGPWGVGDVGENEADAVGPTSTVCSDGQRTHLLPAHVPRSCRVTP